MYDEETAVNIVKLVKEKYIIEFKSFFIIMLAIIDNYKFSYDLYSTVRLVVLIMLSIFLGIQCRKYSSLIKRYRE